MYLDMLIFLNIQFDFWFTSLNSSATTNFFQKRATTKIYRWTKYKECPAAAAAPTEVKLADSEVDLV